MTDRLKEKHSLLHLSVLATGAGLIPTIYAAVTSNSTTLLADLLRCIAEFLAILVSWLVLRNVSKADSSGLNYGVGKLERLACICVAAALFVTFAVSLFTGFRRLLEPEPVVNVEFGLVLALLSVVGNLFILVRTYRVFRRDPTPLMESQCKLFKAKTFATTVVALCLLISWHYPNSAYADGIGSIVLALFMLYSAASILASSVPDLIDRAVEERIQLLIVRSLIEHESQYKGLNRIRTRRSGAKIFVEIFLTFEAASPFYKVSAAAEEICATIQAKLAEAEVVVIPQAEI